LVYLVRALRGLPTVQHFSTLPKTHFTPLIVSGQWYVRTGKDREFSVVIRWAGGDAPLLERPDIPTLAEVEKASREQLAKWYRFLPSGETPQQQKVVDRIAERFKKMGGMTKELSSKIGFGGT